MCYSTKASLDAFVVSTLSSIILFKYNKILSLFFGFVGLMQLYDYIFWLYPKENTINYVTTKIAMITNHLQPIVLGILVMIYNGKLHVDAQKILALYSVIAISYTVVHWNTVDYTLVTEKTKPSLYWKWNDQYFYSIIYPLFLISLLATILLSFNKSLRILMSIMTLGSYIFSYYYYKGEHSIGRFWCYFAAFAPIVIIPFTLK